MSYPTPPLPLLALAIVCGCSGLSDSPNASSHHTPAPAHATPALAAPAPATVAEPTADVSEAADANDVADPGALLGRYRLTYYWVANEKDRSGKPRITLRNRQCKPIARVSRAFRKALMLEGTGRLKDGRIVNVAGGCRCGKRCFAVVDDDKPYGHGVKGLALRPFRSIAAPPHIEVGTVLYVPELDGLTVPGGSALGGTVHNGCVVAEDRGGGVKGRQLDLFTGRRNTYRSFFRRHKINRVSVHRAGDRCDDLDAEGIARDGHG